MAIIVLLLLLLLLLLFLLPTMARRHTRPSRVHCDYNLKQVALAFRIWEGDYNDHFPMLLSTNEGGSMEWGTEKNLWRHFQVMSNELATPKILICPMESDPARKAAWTFDGTAPPVVAGAIPFTNNFSLSYFLGMDAASTNAALFLTGDRNITNGTPIKGGLLLLTTNSPSGWTEKFHMNQGNVAFADGSVQSLDTPHLHDAVRDTGMATNRLGVP